MTKKRVVIVGGVAGGATCAARLRRLDEGAEIVVLDRGPYVSFANCGLPYYVGNVIQDEAKLLLATPGLFRERFNIEVRTRNEVASIDRQACDVLVRDLESGRDYREHYDALVLSPGAARVFYGRDSASPRRIVMPGFMQSANPCCAGVERSGNSGRSFRRGRFVQDLESRVATHWNKGDTTMKVPNLARLVALIPAVLLLVGSSAFAQQGGRGRSAQARLYDPSTEITLKGTIEEVRQVSRSGAWTGTHLTVKADQGAFDVHMGPTTYLANNQMTFAKGDNIEVTGSKVKYAGADTVLAREVRKGDKTLTLRNAAGIPRWSRGRNR